MAYAVGIQPDNSTSAGGLSDIEEKSHALSVTKLAGVCYARSGFGEFVESETTGTLRASAAEHGVSSQDVIAEAVAYNGENITSPLNAANPKIGDPCHTLGASGAGRSYVAISYPINTQIVTRSNKLGEGTGMGIGEEGSPAYTLQEAHSHGVIYAIDRAAFNQGVNAQYDFQIDNSGINSTVVAKGPSAVCHNIPKGKFYVWVVRRLTPLECCRLQGYPDWWAQNLDTADPTEEDLAFWADVFETHRKATDPLKKPKNKKVIKKWLQSPQNDSAEYKMWGNSLAIPCAYTVLAGIISIMGIDKVIP